MDNNYDDIFQSAAAQHGVDPLWLKAQAMNESSLDPNAVNDETGAAGVSQITPKTAQSLGVDPSDPKSAIDGQARLMAENLKRYKNIEDATRAYHGGTDQDNWGPKTEAYVKKVSATYQQLKKGGSMSDPADDFWETDNSAKAPQKDKDVDDFWNSDTAMGERKPAQAAAAPASIPVPASGTGVSATPAQQLPTKGPGSLVPDASSGAVRRGLDFINSPGMNHDLPTLRKQDPEAYAAVDAYMNQNGKNALNEIGTGIMDVPHSLARFVPYPVTRFAGNLMYGEGSMPEEKPANYPQMIVDDNAARNADFKQKYGADTAPNVTRGVGQMVGSAPVVGAAGKVVGAAGEGLNVLAKSYPEVAPVANAVGKGLDFLSGSTSRFAPEGAGALEKTGQYAAGLASKGAAGTEAGAAVTGLTNAGSDEDINKQLKSNVLFSAGLGAGGSLLRDVGVGAGKVMGNMKNSLFGSNLRDLPSQAVDTFASKPIDVGALQTQDPVPGVQRSLAVASQDPGVAELQRQLGKTNPTLNELATNNNEARLSHIEQFSGTPDDVSTAVAARDSQREEDVSQLWQDGQKANARPTVKVIEDILNGPAGQRPAVANTIQQVKDLLIKPNEKGTMALESDPQTLYESVRKHIDDLLDTRNLNNSAGRSAQAQLLQVRDSLDGVIDKASPGYQKYMDNYAEASSKIDGMTYMQGLKLTDSNGNLTLNKVNNAVDKIDQLRAKPGLNAAKHVTDEQYQALKNVQESLKDESIISKSLPLGSPTEQNRKATVKLNNILPGNGDAMSGKITPEMAGAGIGTIAGHMVGAPGAGAVLGDVLGRVGATKSAARRAVVENHLGLMLADPLSYSPSSARLAGSAGPGMPNLVNKIPAANIAKNALMRSGGQ